MKLLKSIVQTTAIIIAGSIVFTMIFGVDHITAWKSLIEGTIIERYYTTFSIIIYTIFWLFVLVLIKQKIKVNNLTPSSTEAREKSLLHPQLREGSSMKNTIIIIITVLLLSLILLFISYNIANIYIRYIVIVALIFIYQYAIRKLLRIS